MKKFPWQISVLILMAFLFLSACNYGTPAVVLTPQHPNQQGPTQAVSQANPEQKVYMPAIQSGKTTPVAQAPEESSQTFDPHVEIQVNNAKLKVGDTLVLVARPVDIGAPVYSLIVRDEGVQDAPPAANVTFENKVAALEDSSQILEFISAEGQSDQATFILRAKKAGVTTVSVEASGAIHKPDSANETMNGGGMGSVLIYVTN